MKKNKMRGTCGTCGRGASCTQDFVGKTEGKNPLGGSRGRRMDNITMNLQEIGWGRDLSCLVQERSKCRTVVKTGMTVRVHKCRVCLE